MPNRQLTPISRTELESVVGGAKHRKKPPWHDGMSNGCGNGTINLPNGTWRQACVDHDRAYYEGGTDHERHVADRKLREDMIAQGAPVWVANTYYAGSVVLGGLYWGKGAPGNPGGH